jgi:hypothetical protein
LTILSEYQRSTGSCLVTPTTIPRYFPETAILTAHNSVFYMDSPPEVCAPPSEDPETERPPPAHGKYVPPPFCGTGGSPKGGKSLPHLKKPNAKYVPPHLRNNDINKNSISTPRDRYIPRHVRQQESNESDRSTPLRAFMESSTPSSEAAPNSSVLREAMRDNDEDHRHFKLGGCADPVFVAGSIMDEQFILKGF